MEQTTISQNKTQQTGRELFTPVQTLIPGIDLQRNFEDGRSELRPKEWEGIEKYATQNILAIWSDLDDCYSGQAYQPEDENIAKALKEFKDQIVIELGAGKKPGGYYISDFAKAKGHVAIEPQYPNYLIDNIMKGINPPKKSLFPGFTPRHELNGTPIAIVEEDMLSFLRRLPNESVSIFCSGIDNAVLPEKWYQREVAGEITRVLNPQGTYIGENLGGHIRLEPNTTITKEHIRDSEGRARITMYKKKREI